MLIPNLKSIFMIFKIKYLILGIFGPKLKSASFCMKFDSQPLCSYSETILKFLRKTPNVSHKRFNILLSFVYDFTDFLSNVYIKNQVSINKLCFCILHDHSQLAL